MDDGVDLIDALVRGGVGIATRSPLRLSATVAAGACRSDEEEMTTSADVQTQSAKAANTPTTLTGSL